MPRIYGIVRHVEVYGPLPPPVELPDFVPWRVIRWRTYWGFIALITMRYNGPCYGFDLRGAAAWGWDEWRALPRREDRHWDFT